MYTTYYSDDAFEPSRAACMNVHLNYKLRQDSTELAKNDFIREHKIHNKNNYKNCPCSEKQLNLLYTRGGNSQPVNVF